MFSITAQWTGKNTFNLLYFSNEYKLITVR